MSKRVIAAVTALGLAFALGACSPEAEAIDLGVDQVDGPLPEETAAQLQQLTETAVATAGASGALVGVYVPWAGEWVEGVGSSSTSGGDIDAGMTFPAAGPARSMTCDVLYALVDAGTVELDDSVTEWLDAYPGEQDVSLRQLCDSTSGLASYGRVLTSRILITPDRVWNPRELAAYGLAQGRQFEPGRQFADSDTGYVLLGLVLERASGKSMAELYREYVFQPLGLNSTAFPKVAPRDGRLGGSYAPDRDGRIDCAAPIDMTALSPSVGSTAGGVETTVGDLATYTQALAAGARPYDVEARFADPMQVSDRQPSWYTSKGGAYQAGSLVGQVGSVPGYMVAAYADPSSGMAVVVAVNNSRASANVARLLAWQLAAVASKVPAGDGRTAPEMGLPWTAESLAGEMSGLAICAE